MAVEDAVLPRYTLTDARNLSPLFDTAVRRDRPVLIIRNGKERCILSSRELLLRVLAPFAFHVDVVPEEGGAFTLWVRELNVGATGPDLRQARVRLLEVVRGYVADYVAQHDFYRHLPDLAAQEPFVRRLTLAEDDAELIAMLFGPREPVAAAG